MRRVHAHMICLMCKPSPFAIVCPVQVMENFKVGQVGWGERRAAGGLIMASCLPRGLGATGVSPSTVPEKVGHRLALVGDTLLKDEFSKICLRYEVVRMS